MAEGRERAEWSRMSELLALIANIHRDPKKCAMKSSDWNPYTERSKPKIAPISVLKDIFILGKLPKGDLL